MTKQEDEANRRETAALWYTELQDPDVSPDTWEAFLEWEKDPANAEACREIESLLGILDRTSLSRPKAEEPGRGRRPAVLALAAAAAALIIGAAALTLQVPKPAPAPLTYATAIGEQETVTLEDGSILTLNTNTKLTVSYSKTERLICLAQGEALFEVKHSERPFLVEARGTVTRALGTEFDIHAEQEAVSVTLIQGSVRVSAAEPKSGAGPAGAMPEKRLRESLVLKPGERVDISPGAAPLVSTIDPARAANWRDGLLQFDNVPLADAIAEMNRYSTTKLRIDDAALASERISGSFPAGKQAEFAESLALYLPITVYQLNDVILISSEPK
jgi:transmembrane sensor